MRNITSNLKRELDSLLKKQKSTMGRVDLGRMIQLSLRESDPQIAAHILPASPEEQQQFDALARQLEEAPNRETIDAELDRLIGAIPALCGSKQAPGASMQAHQKAQKFIRQGERGVDC